MAGTTPQKLVFTFPGQGSFNAGVLRELHQQASYRAEFSTANEIARRILGQEFRPLFEESSAQEQYSVLAACPELDQVGIYVGNYLIARQLFDSGLKPDLLLGHSFGETGGASHCRCVRLRNRVPHGLPAFGDPARPCKRWKDGGCQLRSGSDSRDPASGRQAFA